MLKLSFVIVLIGFSLGLLGQSPHGDNFKMDCAVCHTPDGWAVNQKSSVFDHKQTGFELVGQHKLTDCKSCHTDLKFTETKNECFACHTDMHNTTLGMDCDRCHTPETWIVKNATEMHQQSRFPLMGAHATTDCFNCHQSATNLQFEPLGVQCVDCHRKDYMATTTPNHQQSGYSTNCNECHGLKSAGWNSSDFEHNFFPLTGAHAISCNQCHTTGTFNKISNECISCHQDNYNSAVNPNHKLLNFSLDCAECHQLEPGWKSAEFKQHDALFFPIFSGRHNNEWGKCTDCHTNASNYAEFACTNCHEHNQSSMDGEHKSVSGYSYRNNLCYACHPLGDKSGAFNHSSTGFPLTGSHSTVDCNTCHTNGFTGLSSECAACHLTNYNSTTNPGHQKLGLAVTCADCHSTGPGWKPASFPVHNTYYELAGAHASISNNCAACHNQNYNTTPNTCYACHTANYNSTTAPNHSVNKLSTDCESCHTSTSWKPSTFDHNTTGFVLTGAHSTIKNDCASCHNGNYVSTPNTCFACHSTNYNSAANPNHITNNFSTDCQSCHSSNAWKPGTFDHTTTGFALTGAHAAIKNECASCHNGNYISTPNTCFACHSANYNGTVNPNHIQNNFSTDCQTCHSSTAWRPGTFDHATTGFALTGAHATIKNECASCHNGNYISTPNTCYACHSVNYNSTVNPNHIQNNFSTDCQTCHSSSAWKPGTFDHTTTGFALTGAHATISNECASCHNGNYISTPNTCYACHSVNYTSATNPNHIANSFSTDCQACHNSNAWKPSTFDHNTTGFALTGAHATISNDCASCHNGNYISTPNTCYACHTVNYTSAANPNHVTNSFSTDCQSCHTSNAWNPATFDHNKTGFPLTGAHATIANSCALCHNGNYVSTPNTCYACHSSDYNKTTNPNHLVANFPTNCESCHTVNAWTPATFNHDSQYFPIYSGKHRNQWSKCSECHTVATNYAVFSCIVCHEHNKTDTDREHREVRNYAYTATSCYTCHPRGVGDD